MPPRRETLVVEGMTECLRALKELEPNERKGVRTALRKVGRSVERGASGRIAPKNARTAGGYKTRVRQRGIAVEQSLRKTTGQHPDWGAYQMRHALMPALEANENEMLRDLERALDEVAREFERRP